MSHTLKGSWRLRERFVLWVLSLVERWMFSGLGGEDAEQRQYIIETQEREHVVMRLAAAGLTERGGVHGGGGRIA